MSHFKYNRQNSSHVYRYETVIDHCLTNKTASHKAIMYQVSGGSGAISDHRLIRVSFRIKELKNFLPDDQSKHKPPGINTRIPPNRIPQYKCRKEYISSKIYDAQEEIINSTDSNMSPKVMLENLNAIM